MKKNTGLRTIAILLCLSLVITLSACSANPGAQNDNGTNVPTGEPVTPPSASQPSDSVDKGAYKNLVINDLPIEDSEYLIEKNNDSTYILLEKNILTYALKLPNSSQYYPELSLENGQISLSWYMDSELLLKIDMVEGSTEAYINDSNEPIDIKVAPKTVNNHLYIPINLIVQSLKMKETYIQDLDTTILHFEQDFSKTDLIGCWSDSGTNSFKDYENALQGNGSLASFVTCYQFNEDDTYQVLLVGVGGYDESLVMAKGKYSIIGNTLIYQQVEESLYSGNPLELVYENQLLDHPVYEFIDDYDKDNNQISINGFHLMRVVQ